jgi:hypothetical protein
MLLFCITDVTDNHTAVLYLSCAAITNCVCTVECHLQFDTHKAKTDTKRFPARAFFHGSVPVILGETQAHCKYMQNKCRWSQVCVCANRSYKYSEIIDVSNLLEVDFETNWVIEQSVQHFPSRSVR